jgi:chromate transport protein ChrA
MEPHNIEIAKKAGDYVFAGVTLGAFFSVLPHITALLALVWWLIRIGETDTVQNLINRLRGRR